MKPENIIVFKEKNDEMIFKICDFGTIMSEEEFEFKRINNIRITNFISPPYISPELENLLDA